VAVAAHDIHIDSAGNVTSSRHLTRWLAHPPTWLIAVILLSIAAIWVSFVAHQVLRWQRATGEHRQQLKWLAAGATVTIGLGLIGSLATSGIAQRVLEVGLAALPVPLSTPMAVAGATLVAAALCPRTRPRVAVDPPARLTRKWQS
jgi:hypothetical protein